MNEKQVILMFDKSKTIGEISALTGIAPLKILAFITGMDTVKEEKFGKPKKIKELPAWYRHDLTVKEMARLSGKPETTIRDFIFHHGLPYKKFVKHEDISWYHPDRTIQEMMEISHLSYGTINSILIRRGLEFKRWSYKTETKKD